MRYQVEVSLEGFYSRINKFDLGEYNSQTPTLIINANDPDDACYLAYQNLKDLVASQSTAKRTTALMIKAKDLFVVKKVIPI